MELGVKRSCVFIASKIPARQKPNRAGFSQVVKDSPLLASVDALAVATRRACGIRLTIDGQNDESKNLNLVGHRRDWSRCRACSPRPGQSFLTSIDRDDQLWNCRRHPAGRQDSHESVGVFSAVGAFPSAAGRFHSFVHALSFPAMSLPTGRRIARQERTTGR